MGTKKEPLEIERKFLIRYPDLSELEKFCTKKISITQIYLQSQTNISRRIRKMKMIDKATFWFTEKEKISNITRIERERQISEEEYQELLIEALPGVRIIRKTRYYLPSGKYCFEVDIFPEWDDRAFVEVELEAEDSEFIIPDCLEVIKEVTDDGRYTNKMLAINGFIYDEI